MTTEAIDPLYTGEYAVAPYERPPVTPSGSPVMVADWSGVAGTSGYYVTTAWDAASSCSPGGDGTQSAPANSDASGWWNGQLCPAGHSSWWNVQVNAGSSWTLEVTALDETGAATTYKAQPVIGVWNKGDSGLPTVASAAGVDELDGAGGDAAADAGELECGELYVCGGRPVWRREAGLCVQGAGAVCGECEARGGEPGRWTDRDRRGGIPAGKPGEREWRAGDGGEFEREPDCGEGAEHDGCRCIARSAGGCDGDGCRDGRSRRTSRTGLCIRMCSPMR